MSTLHQSAFCVCFIWSVYILQQLHVDQTRTYKRMHLTTCNPVLNTSLHTHLVLCEVMDGRVLQFLVLVLHVLQDLMEVLAMLNER